MGVHWYRGHTEKSESNEEAERETEAYIIHRRKCMGIGPENIPSRRISRRRGAHVYVIQQWILATPIMEAVLDLLLEIFGKHPNFREREIAGSAQGLGLGTTGWPAGLIGRSVIDTMFPLGYGVDITVLVNLLQPYYLLSFFAFHWKGPG